MQCLAVGTDARRGQAWVEALENQGDVWRCQCLHEAVASLARGTEVLVLLPGPGAQRLMDELARTPPVEPPFIICDGWAHPRADGCCAPEEGAALVARLTAWECGGRLPGLCATLLPELTCLARALLRSLGMRPQLRAMAFLPDMLALATAHPALLQDLAGRLYPLSARRFGLSVPQVERRLRLAVESTWNRAALAELERFFGHSVDPERGKPTNKEFLCRLSERLLLAEERCGRAI